MLSILLSLLLFIREWQLLWRLNMVNVFILGDHTLAKTFLNLMTGRFCHIGTFFGNTGIFRRTFLYQPVFQYQT